MRRNNRHRLMFGLVAVALSASVAGCSGTPFKLKEPPAGFVEVENYYGNARFKGADNVGVNVNSFGNMNGGSRAYWSKDLVEKLATRGYTLTKQTKVSSNNGVPGTRFDFDYTTPVAGEEKFFTVVLFVTDEHRVVVQVAGDRAHKGAFDGRTNEVLTQLKVGGCRLGSDVCKEAEPGSLVGKFPAADLNRVPGTEDAKD